MRSPSRRLAAARRRFGRRRSGRLGRARLSTLRLATGRGRTLARRAGRPGSALPAPAATAATAPPSPAAPALRPLGGASRAARSGLLGRAATAGLVPSVFGSVVLVPLALAGVPVLEAGRLLEGCPDLDDPGLRVARRLGGRCRLGLWRSVARSDRDGDLGRRLLPPALVPSATFATFAPLATLTPVALLPAGAARRLLLGPLRGGLSEPGLIDLGEDHLPAADGRL